MSHRGASVGLSGRRFTPYIANDGPGIKSTASCPDLTTSCSQTILVSSPEDDYADSLSDVSSTATLVNNSFDCDKTELDSPSGLLFPDKPCKFEDNPKCQLRRAFHQKRLDYVSELIDHTCDTLNEVWPVEGVPSIFRYRKGANFGYTDDSAFLTLDDFHPNKQEPDLIPLRKFVKEILRRSRSTCSTLQTALCYLEAIRCKIPEAQQAEKEGRGCRGDQTDHEGRLTYECLCDTADKNERMCHLCEELNDSARLRKLPSPPPTPLPKLPSALLCPRRAFMGALVLSAKFVQDKAYSNRAWAKLCGLPAREVGRCERAIGDALEWRLWVGRDKAFALSGLEHKLGKAPTLLSACIAVEDFDRKDCLAEGLTPRPLGRSKTLPALEFTPADGSATVLLKAEDTFVLSPTPSLSCSTSSVSTCPSALFTPLDNSPLPSFVSNDPCSKSVTRTSLTCLRLRNFLCQQALDTSMFKRQQRMSCVQDEEQDVFGIRGGQPRIEVI